MQINKNGVRLLWRLLQSYAVAATILFMTGSGEPQVVSAIVFLLAFALLSRDAAVADRRVCIVSGVFAVFFAGAVTLSNYAYLEKIAGGFFSVDTFCTFVLAWICFFMLLRMLYRALQGVRVVTDRPRRLTGTQVFFLCFGGLALVYTVAFLCHYPGNVMADTRWQLVQIVGLDPYTNHHPMAHTLAMKVFFDLGYALFHTQNAGVACITISQYLAVSAAFSYTLMTLYERWVRTWLIAVFALFFAFAPNNLLFAITPVKDIPFSILALVMLVALLRLLDGIRLSTPLKRMWGDFLLLFIGSVGACTMRTNGVYAFIALLPLCLLILKKRQLLVLPAMAGALLLSLLFRGPVLTAMQIPPPDTVEALSLPVQHIARVVTDGCELTSAERALLNKVVDVDKIPETYVPYTSDYIKALVRETDNQAYIVEHAGEYLRLWIQLGLRYPKAYLYAQIDETVGFWYPNIQYESLYLGGIHSEMTRLDIETTPKLTGWIPAMLTKWLTGPRDVPVYALIFSIGTATWIGVAMFGMAIVNRRRACLLPYLFQLLVFGTLMVATPVHAEFRYLYSLFVALPLFMLLPFSGQYTGRD